MSRNNLQDGSAGRRDRYVTIEGVLAAGVVGDSGLPSDTWQCLGHSWMSREDLSGDERFGSDQEIASAQTRWVAPWQPCLDPEVLDVAHTRRLSYQGRLYDILQAVPMGRKQSIAPTTIARTG